jgi:hypothetical protein
MSEIRRIMNYDITERIGPTFRIPQVLSYCWGKGTCGDYDVLWWTEEIDVILSLDIGHLERSGDGKIALIL